MYKSIEYGTMFFPRIPGAVCKATGIGWKLRWNQVRNLSGPATVTGERNRMSHWHYAEKGDVAEIREPGYMHGFDRISDGLFYAIGNIFFENGRSLLRLFKTLE